MNQQQTWVISLTAVLAAIGGKELLMFLVKSWQKNREKRNETPLHAQMREDFLIADNIALLNELLKEVKEELKVKREIEVELREKNSDCKARLDMLLKEMKKNEGKN